ncbi:MAG: PqqD family protein [Rickettsiales bacterium]|jgi:hypothetical protein|nr:PqqD family protein [Rickettsiales bacterium]
MYYKLNEEKMFCDISDDVAIIINSETGIYYGMNNFSTAVFENIIGSSSMESILGALEKLSGAPDDIEKRLKDFVKELLKYEIITKVATGKNLKVSIDNKFAKSDNFVLRVSEYSDAQELLLADPIHDIKDETGWQPVLNAKEDNKDKIKRKKEKEAKASINKKSSSKGKIKGKNK